MSLNYYACNENELAAAFQLQCFLPPDQMIDTSSFKPTRKKKVRRKAYPSIEEQIQMRDVNQTSPSWNQWREGSDGGSGLSPVIGYDDNYVSNVLLWRRESGREMVRPSLNPDDYIPMQRGHYFEDETTKIYCIIMNAIHYSVGMILHWSMPFIHISPDGLVELMANYIHNQYTMNDSSCLLLENKNPIHHAYQTIINQRNTVPSQYVAQLMMQLITFLCNAVDFTCSWRCNEYSPALSMEKFGFPEGIFLVGETRITRVYRNQKAVDCILKYLSMHKMHLQTKDILLPFTCPMNWKEAKQGLSGVKQPNENQNMELYIELQSTTKPNEEDIHILYGGQKIQFEPEHFHYDVNTKKLILFPEAVSFEDWMKQFRAMSIGHPVWMNQIQSFDAFRLRIQYPPQLIRYTNFPSIVILPLKQIKFLLQVPRDEETGMFLPPIDVKTGKLQGEIAVQVLHLYDQPPLRCSMKALHEKSDDCEVLTQVPIPDSLPELHQIKNPLWLELMRKHPNKSISDLIWMFSTHKII